MKSKVRCIIKINDISEKNAEVVINSLKPDNVDLENKIIIRHEFREGSLIYTIENRKSISSGMYTINDLIRNLNIVLKLII